MLTVAEYLAHVLDAVAPLPPQTVPLPRAHDRVLVGDVLARLAVPPFDNSAMDGFAVQAADVTEASGDNPVTLSVHGDVPAGSQTDAQLQPGAAIRIMTGAPIPTGADAVVPVEATNHEPGPHAGKGLADVVIVNEPVETGRHIRRAGEDVAAGDLVLSAGTRLRARHLSAAAATGHGTLDVVPCPRVGVLATGAELTEPGTELGPGRIPDSNSTLIAGLVHEAGAEPVLVDPVGDDPAALAELLNNRLGALDALITTGGVSAGAFDVVKELLGAPQDSPLRESAGFTGNVQFTRVSMQPGKPQGFGLLTPTGGDRAVPVLTLPGNPVSAFVSFHVFAAPVLARLAGLRDPVGLRTVRPAVVTAGWHPSRNRTQFIPVTVDASAGGLRARPAADGGSRSHLVASLARANALAVIPADVDQVEPGDVVDVMMVS